MTRENRFVRAPARFATHQSFERGEQGFRAARLREIRIEAGGVEPLGIAALHRRGREQESHPGERGLRPHRAGELLAVHARHEVVDDGRAKRVAARGGGAQHDQGLVAA